MTCRQTYIFAIISTKITTPLTRKALFNLLILQNDVSSFNNLRFKFVGSLKVTVMMAIVQILEGTGQCTETKVYYKTY